MLSTIRFSVLLTVLNMASAPNVRLPLPLRFFQPGNAKDVRRRGRATLYSLFRRSDALPGEHKQVARMGFPAITAPMPAAAALPDRLSSDHNAASASPPSSVLPVSLCKLLNHQQRRSIISRRSMGFLPFGITASEVLLEDFLVGTIQHRFIRLTRQRHWAKLSSCTH